MVNVNLELISKAALALFLLNLYNILSTKISTLYILRNSYLKILFWTVTEIKLVKDLYLNNFCKVFYEEINLSHLETAISFLIRL